MCVQLYVGIAYITNAILQVNVHRAQPNVIGASHNYPRPNVLVLHSTDILQIWKSWYWRIMA